MSERRMMIFMMIFFLTANRANEANFLLGMMPAALTAKGGEMRES